jgi:hypothetical protein
MNEQHNKRNAMELKDGKLYLDWEIADSDIQPVGHYYWIGRGKLCGPGSKASSHVSVTAKDVPLKDGTLWAPAPAVQLPPEATMISKLSARESELLLSHVKTLSSSLGPNITSAQLLNAVLHDMSFVPSKDLRGHLLAKIEAEVTPLPSDD